jgi:hypothetical protein
MTSETRSRSTAPPRRRFLAGFGGVSAAIGALWGSAQPAGAQAAGSGPRRHDQDAWMDTLPTAHRMVFDAVSPDGCDDIRHYASNVFFGNRIGYGVESADVGVIIVLRHNATPFGYDEAMWRKYGKAFGAEMALQPSDRTANPANASGETLDSLTALGVHYAVCEAATRRFAARAARAAGADSNAVFEELRTHLVANAHLVPVGIVAVGRAQEHGYAFGYAG